MISIKSFLIFLLTINVCENLSKRSSESLAFRFPTDEVMSKTEQCTSYNGKPGSCVPVTQCSPAKAINDYRVLRKAMCGFIDYEPKICCPIAPIAPKPTPKPKPKPKPVTPAPTPKPPVITLPPPPPVTLPPAIPIDLKTKFPQECGVSNSTLSRVVNGEPAEPGAWPWMAAIFFDESGIKSAKCGAALVNEETAITAAHCVVENNKDNSLVSPKILTVRLGEHSIDQDSPDDAVEDFAVKRIVSHPQFDGRTNKNDVALLFLEKKVTFKRRISPVCLPFDSQLLRNGNIVGRTAMVTGWGETFFQGPSSDILQQASLSIIAPEECRKAFEKIVPITKVYICAGSQFSKKDSCRGDSGGPLVMIDRGRWYLAGIVSFGRRCASQGFPGVYTRVTEFLDWIEKNA